MEANGRPLDWREDQEFSGQRETTERVSSW